MQRVKTDKPEPAVVPNDLPAGTLFETNAPEIFLATDRNSERLNRLCVRVRDGYTAEWNGAAIDARVLPSGETLSLEVI